jgi:hypothetical protein
MTSTPFYLDILYALLAGLFGFAIGLAELVGRYRDAPLKALRSWPALLYVGLNALASAGAYGLSKIYFNQQGSALGDASEVVTRVLLSGFGAMAFFRSSLFNVRVGDSQVGIGPSVFLSIVLSSADRAVDRERANARAEAVKEIMDGTQFSAFHLALPALCFQLLQNVSDKEQQETRKALDALAKEQLDDYSRTLGLGLTLMNLVGEDVLREAVNALKTKSLPPSAASASPAPAPGAGAPHLVNAGP